MALVLPGIGYATQVVIAYAAVSYIVIQAWAFFYLFSSFSSEVPWASCRNVWNTGRPTQVSHTVRGCVKQWLHLRINVVLPMIKFRRRVG